MASIGETHEVRVLAGEREHVLQVPHGANLRQALLQAGLSPYGSLSRVTNCGGRGLCATCGVLFEQVQPTPGHWHDRLAASFGYPRLSCQITVEGPLTIRLLTDKIMWGPRDPQRRYSPPGSG